jgi:hypothetical protein
MELGIWIYMAWINMFMPKIPAFNVPDGSKPAYSIMDLYSFLICQYKVMNFMKCGFIYLMALKRLWNSLSSQVCCDGGIRLGLYNREAKTSIISISVYLTMLRHNTHFTRLNETSNRDSTDNKSMSVIKKSWTALSAEEAPGLVALPTPFYCPTYLWPWVECLCRRFSQDSIIRYSQEAACHRCHLWRRYFRNDTFFEWVFLAPIIMHRAGN